VFNFFNATASRNIGLYSDHFEFLPISFLNHLSKDENPLRVFLDFGDELSDFLIEYLEAIYLFVTVSEEKTIIKHFFIRHNSINSIQVSGALS